MEVGLQVTPTKDAHKFIEYAAPPPATSPESLCYFDELLYDACHHPDVLVIRCDLKMEVPGQRQAVQMVRCSSSALCTSDTHSSTADLARVHHPHPREEVVAVDLRRDRSRHPPRIALSSIILLAEGTVCLSHHRQPFSVSLCRKLSLSCPLALGPALSAAAFHATPFHLGCRSVPTVDARDRHSRED